MNHTLTLTLAILLLAATGRGETNDLIIGTSPPPVAVTGDITMMTNAPSDYTSNIHLSDKGIRKLAASGEICRIFGHWYPNVWIGERKCKLCGKVEPNWRIK